MRKAKTHIVVCIAVIAVFAFAEADRFGAQNGENRTNPPHYKLVDLGTLGGPQGYLVPGSGEDFSGSSVLNASGTVVGFADTSSPDPFPNFCFWDCNVVHAFAARENGELADLGALSEGSSLPM